VSEFETDTLGETVRRAMEWLDFGSIIKSGARVAIKPNFTYPFHKPGVTTTPRMIEELVAIVRERTDCIRIVEADGGSNSWPQKRLLRDTTFPEICRKYDAVCVNLSKARVETAEEVVLGRGDGVIARASAARDGCVHNGSCSKVHAMTYVSLALRINGDAFQIPRGYAPSGFHLKIIAINKLLRPSMAIFDGTYFLNRTGPMNGDVVRRMLLIGKRRCRVRI